MARTACRRPPVLLMAALLACLVFTPSAAAETWTFSAREVSAGQGKTPTVLRGSAIVRSDTLDIQADVLELSGDDFSRITGSGGVYLKDNEKDITVTCRRFEYDREAKVIYFRNLVELVDEEQNLVLRCESMDLLEEEDLVIMQVAVRLIQDDTICRGESATFQRKENLLEISGNPVVWREDDEYRANRITVNLDTDDIVMDGAVSGALTTEDESQPEEGAADVPSAGGEGP